MSFDARSVNRTLLHLGPGVPQRANSRGPSARPDRNLEIACRAATHGMFLALGVSFRGLHDGFRLAPGSNRPDGSAGHAAESVCARDAPANPTRALHCLRIDGAGPFFEQQEGRLPFRGAPSFLAQSALRYVDPVAMPRYISVQAGLLVIHVPRGILRVGARCTQWMLEKLATFCRLTSVRLHVEAQAMYGQHWPAVLYIRLLGPRCSESAGRTEGSLAFRTAYLSGGLSAGPGRSRGTGFHQP
ncbi:hypothetical protein HPB48_000419 [Haemaphysalis longicornis]|uniref:Uncharacterized protein n=1 Tax=Haemaphysalis longicornis TaxID=44386 RepID=A0A9J6FYM2_HAELO|nr:hypothetical protein HPB48_000419 [Haemaphysalis longicornis]